MSDCDEAELDFAGGREVAQEPCVGRLRSKNHGLCKNWHGEDKRFTFNYKY